MMRALAIDTSSEVCSVAIVEKKSYMNEAKVLAEYTINNNKTHSEKLIPMIKEIIESVNLTINDVDIFAVSIGPGSFTGLRIGVTVAKVFSFVCKKPLIGVPTLDVLAYNISAEDCNVCVLMDARKDQVYAAVYDLQQGCLNRITDYMGCSIYDLSKQLNKLDKNVVFAGDAALLHKEFFKSMLNDRYKIAADNLLLQRASSLAIMAIEKANRREYDDCFQLTPFYLRKSQAERSLKNKKAKKE